MLAVRPGDYVSPNLQVVCPDEGFPNMVVGDVRASSWPHLRREITHNWYVDRRWPTVGFISRDEAAIVYNTARMFENLPCLEIGCWRGWATVHLALGTHSLDVLDPILDDPATRAEITSSLASAGVDDRVSLIGEGSPGAIERLVGRTGKRWSMAFVDGDHDGDAPVRDVEMIARHLTPDAAILLHDVAAPGPAAALTYLRDHGWRTAIYQTMQIIGVATRGACQPVWHRPDAAQNWGVPEHAASFAVIGEAPVHTIRRLTLALGGVVPASDASDNDMTELPSRAEAEACLLAAQNAVQALAQARNRYVQLQHEAARALETAQLETAGLRHDAEVGRRFDDLHVRFLRMATELAAQTAGLAVARAETDEARAALDLAREDARTATAEARRLSAMLNTATHTLSRIDRIRADQALGIQHTASELTRVRGDRDQLVAVLAAAQAAEAEAREALHHHVEALSEHRLALEVQRTIDRFARDLAQPRVLIGLARRLATGGASDVRARLTAGFAAEQCPVPLPDAALDWLCRTRTYLGLLRRRVLAGRTATAGLVAGALRAYLPVPDLPRVSPAGVPTEISLTLALLSEQVANARAEAETERAAASVALAAAESRAAEAAGKFATSEATISAQSQALYDAQLELAKLQARLRIPAASEVGSGEGR